MQPYPDHLIECATLPDGTTITIRPIRPEDAEIEQEFVRNLSNESRFFRFMDAVRELSPPMLAHFTQLDYDRHMALIAVTRVSGKDIEIAVARYVVADDESSCEFAIVVADEWQHRGVGTRLMRALINAARARGLRAIYGEVLAGNSKMLQFMGRLGFNRARDKDDPRVIRVDTTL
jgi:acetyltransferase